VTLLVLIGAGSVGVRYDRGGLGPVTLGETTEYVRVTGTFDETTTTTVDVDEAASRSGVVRCCFGVADTGWHVPWS
jgi:hypothetical protein